MKQNYRALWNQKKYVRMACANFINRLGDSIDMMAFGWMTYELTNSPAWTALVFGVNYLPNVFIQPFCGALVERLDKKKVILVCDILRGLMTAGIAIFYMNGHLQAWMLLAITFLNNTFESFRNPASSALLPSLLAKDQYEYGLSLNQTLSRICELIGIGVSGILLAWVGIAGAIWVDAISFFCCAVILMTIPIVPTHANADNTLTISAYWHTLKEGFHYLKVQPILMLICFLSMALNMLMVPINSFQSAYISGTLHQTTELYSLTSFAISIGLGIGSFLYPFLHERISNRNLLLMNFITIFMYDISMGILPLISSILFLYILFTTLSFLFGVYLGVGSASVNVCLMKRIEPAYMARISSLAGAFSTAAMPVTSFFVSGIALYLDVVQIFFLFALFTFILNIGMISVKLLKEL